MINYIIIDIFDSVLYLFRVKYGSFYVQNVRLRTMIVQK